MDKKTRKTLRLMAVSAISALLLLLAACDTDNNNNNVGVNDNNASVNNNNEGEETEPPIRPIPHQIDQSEREEFNDLWLPLIPPAEGTFELTESEHAFYDEFILTGNIAALYGAAPASMIKIQMQAAIDGYFERSFILYHPHTLDGLTPEEYLPTPETPLEHTGTPETRQAWANVLFSQIDDGELEIRNDLALVMFYTELDEHVTLWTRQNEDGVWLIEFN